MTHLPCSFRQHPDHEQARQPIAYPSSITMIRDGLQAGIERISIKKQRFVGKMKRSRERCIFHGETFVCYVEFGKFPLISNYVDYERLPIEELSENGASIPHNRRYGMIMFQPFISYERFFFFPFFRFYSRLCNSPGLGSEFPHPHSK